MFFRHHSDKLLIPVILLLIFIMGSYREKYHLRSDIPAAFFTQNPRSSSPSVDRQIAMAYWDIARGQLQWKYPYGHPLPPDPPPEFQVNAHLLEAGASDMAMRILYWHRLQQLWYLPETWKKEYGWDLTWARDLLESGVGWLKDESNRLLSMH